MKILKEDAIVLVIDYQEKLIPAIYNNNVVVDNSVRLLKGIKLLGIPFIVTQQYTKGLGMTISDIEEALESDFEYYDKITFSCWADDKIRKKISTMNKKNIILCGTEAHICVMQTALDLIEAGYNVILVVDCIGSRKEIDKMTAVKRLYLHGVFVSTYEALLFEFLKTAKADKFKEISRLIK